MAKGGEFEREMSKLFSLWWTGGERDDIFWRTSNSGGRAGMRAKQGKTTAGAYGDMGAVDPIGKPLIDFFTFEFKRGYQKSIIHDFFDHPEGNAKTLRNWEKWIQHVHTESVRAGAASWMIVHRRNGRKALAVVPGRLFFLFEDSVRRNLVRSHPKFKATILLRGEVGEPAKDMSIIGMPLDNLLEVIQPGDIKDWVDGRGE